ncbi:MAG TPA: hypothetical protein VHH34_12290 [Pseudonocardiaceae bacterium]|nr:hypothetical protein [Pseudonocardiaceae bacterium]
MRTPHGPVGPGAEVGRVRRVVPARALPDAEGTPDHTVHLVAVPLREDGDGSKISGLCGTRLLRGRIETVAVGEGVWCTCCFVAHLTGVAPASDSADELSASARVGAVLAYQELGWPVTVRAGQVSLNLDLDLDAVAVVIPAGLATHVAEILDQRRCPPAMLTHPALATHRVLVAGERYGVVLGRPAGVHRVTGTLLLPPSVTEHGPVRWVRPPRQHTLKLCREIDVCAALATAFREPPPPSPTVF